MEGETIGKLSVKDIILVDGVYFHNCECECGNRIKVNSAYLSGAKKRDSKDYSCEECRDKRKMSPEMKAASAKIRSVVHSAFRRINIRKKDLTIDVLGCTVEYARWYIESRFVEGMSWKNRSKWHIDHIIPCSYAKNEEDLNILNHHTNLRPMWGPENLSKSKSVPDNVDELFAALKGRKESMTEILTIKDIK